MSARAVAVGVVATVVVVAVGLGVREVSRQEEVACGTLTFDRPGPAAASIVRGGGDGETFCGDFADPYVLAHDGRLQAFSTNRDGTKVPTLTLAEALDGGDVQEALPSLPPWAEPAAWAVWAPSVLHVDGAFVLYFTAATKDLVQCIGVATAASADGPFASDRHAPLACAPDPPGDVTLHGFVAAGTR